MGFDNESILNPETVPGEYCCPLCRQLVYPAEAQQTPCGHLFCKECIVYILGTTRCCPYDNHPINEADPKGLMQANVLLYESLCRIPVRCVFHKSGCVWQGQLTDSLAHSTNCPYGSSSVFCNKCGMQIMHRQIPEHVVSCPGTAAHSKGVQQMPGNSVLGQSAPQQALGSGHIGPGGHQVQQVVPGAKQTQQAVYQAAAYANGQEQPHSQPIVRGQWNSQEQHYQQPHEQYHQNEQSQQIQQLQQSRQQIILLQTQQLPSVQKPYSVQESVPQQYQQEGHPHPFLQSQQSMLQQSLVPYDRLPTQSQNFHEQSLQSQNLPPIEPQQNTPAFWEKQLHREQMEHVRDAHGAEQLQLHDPNVSQHPRLSASMQQPPVSTRSFIQPWQGHPSAATSDVRDPQTIQSFHNNQCYPALANQLLQGAPFHPTVNQPAHLASEEVASLNAQNNELARAKHFSVLEGESGYLSAPHVHPAQHGAVLEKVTYEQQINMYRRRSDQVSSDLKEGPAYGHEDAFNQAARMPLSATNDRHLSVNKQQHQFGDVRLTTPFIQREGREAPKDTLTSGIGEYEDKQSLLSNKNNNSVRQGVDSPMPQLSARIHNGGEAEDGSNQHALKNHTHPSNESFSSEAIMHGSCRSQDRTDPFPPKLQSHHEASKPLQPDVDRVIHLRRMISDYGKTPVEDDFSRQHPSKDGFLGTHQSQTLSEISHGYATETSYPKPSLDLPPVECSLQVGYMEASRQAMIGGYKGTPIESMGPILDMPIKDNDRIPHDRDKSLLYKAGNLDAREILHLSSLSRFHANSPERGSGTGDFISRYPMDSQSVGMRSGMFPFSTEFDKEPRLPRDIGEKIALEAGLRKAQSLESGPWSKLPMEMEPWHRNAAEFGADAGKLYHDGPSRFSLSADLGMRPGTVDCDATFGSLPDIGRRPGFLFDVEPQPKIPSQVEHRPFDLEARPRFPGDSTFRPRIDLNFEHPSYGLPVDARHHPGFSLDVDGRPRFPDILREVMGRTPDAFGGIRSDITRPASEVLNQRLDLHSPGRGPVDFPIRREPGYLLGLPSQFDDIAPRLPLRLGMELNRDPLNNDPRINLHRHSLLDDPERLLHVGGRNLSFSSSRPGVEHLPGGRPSIHAFIDEAPHHKMTDDIEKLDTGRKRPQLGSAGWCRICLIDCFTVEGLREHSQTKEHQMKTLELVDNIKRDHPKRQMNSKDAGSEAADDSKSEHEVESSESEDSESEAENNEKSNSSSSSPISKSE